MTDALKPCPFCGTQSVNDFDKWAVVRNIAHFVRCPECHSRTGNWGAHESALDAWNRRASPPDLEGVREALTAAIRAANLALFVIRKQGVMPNSSWEAGFNSDLKQAESALAALSSLPNSPGGVGDGWCDDMSKAPRDGTAFLAADWKIDNDGAVIYWDEDGDRPYRWRLADCDIAFHDNRFTHWTPIPPIRALATAPTAEGEQPEGGGSYRGNDE